MGVIHRRSQQGWDGVPPQTYEDPSLDGVRKHELIGEQEGALQYRIRYFQLEPGARTARERHPHDHGVMIVRGRARVTLGERDHEVGEGDVVYVAGEELHCFETLGDEPLGFVCVVGPRAERAAQPSAQRAAQPSSGPSLDGD